MLKRLDFTGPHGKSRIFSLIVLRHKEIGQGKLGSGKHRRRTIKLNTRNTYVFIVPYMVSDVIANEEIL